MPPAAPDPARQANEKVLADRQARIDEHMKAIPDLGLDLKAEVPESAEKFFAGNGMDEWDKKAFGDPARTTTRWVYGPDPLIDTCPALLAAIEKEGLDAYAEFTRAAILLKEHEAVPDPIMRRGLYAAIKKFGKEQVADAFAARILKIPARQVEYEIGDETFGDPLLLGSNALRDTVVRWGNEPGMSYKFLSQRCMDVLGLRGYVIVKDDCGDPVKAGTLYLGKIPMAVAEGRRRKYSEESEQRVKDAEEEYLVEQDRLVRGAGARAAGSRPLATGERVRATASETEALVGSELEMGVHFERQT
jgi:hypothetical protein